MNTYCPAELGGLAFAFEEAQIGRLAPSAMAKSRDESRVEKADDVPKRLRCAAFFGAFTMAKSRDDLPEGKLRCAAG